MTGSVDRVSGSPGEALPGWTGRWAIGSDHCLDPDPAPVGLRSRDELESDDINALGALAEALDDALTSGSWRTLDSTPLLSGHNDATFELQRRERDLETQLASLARICERFITRLGERAELLPVARVRRPARRALERLGAHTEDWAGRTLAGPVPRRAMAITRENDPDIYENRMVAELVHPILSTALAQRIHQLSRVRDDLADLTRAEDEGTYSRRNRIYRFWGEDAQHAAVSSNQVRQTLRTLEALAARIQNLRGSTLVRLMRGRRTGQRTLRRTNVIENDRNYHAAGLLWTAFEKEPIVEESPEERRRRLKHRHQSFDNYVLGLVVRALNDLGYQPADDQIPSGGSPVTLSGPWGQVVLDRDDASVLTIRSNGTNTRFVPLLDFLSTDDKPETISERWQSVHKASTGLTVVVYLAASDAALRVQDGQAMPLTSAGLDTPNDSESTTAVPVSPLETTSLERLARAVAIAVQTPALAAYPVPITLPTGRIPRRLIDHLTKAAVTRRGLSPLFYRRDPDHLDLRRPLTRDESVNLDHVLQQLIERTGSAGWERDLVREIAGLSEAITTASNAVRPLLTCPSCEHKADTTQIPRDDDTLLVVCQSCNTSWGHHRCGQCQSRIPFIEPERKVRNPDVNGPGWVERILGRDALASPCWARTAPIRYICPTCRVCPVTGTPGGSNCTRCSDLR
ncbi:hypothetical protein [Saccharopolyspora sp. NPDC050642]|uniref:hypothetical protein n=1 Tax=Saccharopolyspora sp. NPDC050642 TaxID=3157099 RepID=UPI0033DA0447